MRWSDLSRATRIGSLVGVAVVVLPLARFLMYVGVGIVDATPWEWARPFAFSVYLLVVLGIPAIVGGFVGSFFRPGRATRTSTGTARNPRGPAA